MTYQENTKQQNRSLRSKHIWTWSIASEFVYYTKGCAGTLVPEGHFENGHQSKNGKFKELDNYQTVEFVDKYKLDVFLHYPIGIGTLKEL